MEKFINNSFPRSFFGSENKKARLGYNQYVQTASNNRVIIDVIRESLPEEGIFFQHQNSSIQIKVEDSYFDDLLPFIEENIFKEAFDLCKSSILAFSSKEVKEHSIDFSKIPLTASFKVEGCYGVEPIDRDDVAKVWFLLIASPDVEKLRLEYGLPKWVNHQPFYLLMGFEKYYFSFDDILKFDSHSLTIKRKTIR
jgi:hypothetical protein